MQKLPVDISTFSQLRENNYLYVDKTEYIYHLITGGRRYFLSRPRRFGKSLLISTMKEILTGKRALFNGLWIDSSDYVWHEHSVITFDFSQLDTKNLDVFEESLKYRLLTVASQYEITDISMTGPISVLFDSVVRKLFKQYGRVAILVDEYDNPLLHILHDRQRAEEIRTSIQRFFTMIKSLDEYIQFVFITGVSSFTKAGLFSGINNLQMLTLRDEYATICGYTDQEVDYYFSEYINAWAEKDNILYDVLRQNIKAWYNGYSFGYKVPQVYNPFSIMNALAIKKFENFWFQSGTPTFLVEVLKKEYETFDQDHMYATQDFLGIFDIDTIPLLSLMFQAGYVTISDYDSDSELFTLAYPNREVRVSFQKYLLHIATHIDPHVAGKILSQLRSSIINNNIEQFITLLQQLFAHIPYQLHISQEKFYHALFIMILVGANITYHAEYSTSHGRIDLVLDLLHVYYIIEVKFNTNPQEALSQIEERRYYERFVMYSKRIILVGMSFNRSPQHFDITYVTREID